MVFAPIDLRVKDSPSVPSAPSVPSGSLLRLLQRTLVPILCLLSLAVTYIVLPTPNGVIQIRMIIPLAIPLAGPPWFVSALPAWGRS
jgi:hypothetical protein